MPGLREAGLLGASAALTGGLAYVVWSFLSSGAKEPKPGRETVKAESDPATGKAATRGEPVTGSVAVAAAAPDVSSAQNASITKSSLVEKGKQVLVLGLDGAGKTSLLHCLTTAGQEQDVEPTQGFNAVSINRDDLQIEFLEIGGKENLRCYWQRYIPKALVLVFVVDSSKAELFSQAKKHLHELVASDPHLPLVVLANKQDLPGACSITELHDGLSLTEVGDQRKLFLIGTYVRKGDTELSSGVQDARELIIQMVCDMK
ncbi:ADP-ribosylation factor-like protein 9 [Lampris incognitus]|uniref:ADP-ribosylation factor-like protein 9 n=1 Tax=Lampris incognitus TaxID=2546036 RepID=UPI0024B5AD1F|nr:ADP-ribosylation factor-like protein 9 [Lampris incognitus]